MDNDVGLQASMANGVLVADNSPSTTVPGATGGSTGKLGIIRTADGRIDINAMMDRDARQLGFASFADQFEQTVGLPGVGTLKLAGSLGKLGQFFGKFPMKKGAMGKLQPFDPKTGRFLSPKVSGFMNSEAAQFTQGFSQGISEGMSDVSTVAPIGRAGNLGHSIGTGIANIMAIFEKLN